MSNRTLLMGWRTRWNRGLLQFLRRRAPAAVDIEDLAQETYLRLLRARDLQAVRNPQAYLLRVAAHVIAEWRDRTPRLEVIENVDEELLVDENTPEFALDAELSQAQLDSTLAALPPVTCAVILMKFRDNQSCKEIARQLGLTDRQVRRHLTRGYEKLRAGLHA